MKYILIFIGIIALSLIVSRYFTTSVAVKSELVPEASVTLPSVVTPGDVPQTAGYAEIAGVAIIDTTGGLPGIPYIKYTLEDGSIATKQLIFADARGCHPNAGDIPCVPSASTQSGYPSLTEGQPLRVSGYIRADRFLVAELQTP